MLYGAEVVMAGVLQRSATAAAADVLKELHVAGSAYTFSY
jgi:hypothetical protein